MTVCYDFTAITLNLFGRNLVRRWLELEGKNELHKKKKNHPNFGDLGMVDKLYIVYLPTSMAQCTDAAVLSVFIYIGATVKWRKIYLENFLNSTSKGVK